MIEDTDKRTVPVVMHTLTVRVPCMFSGVFPFLSSYFTIDSMHLFFDSHIHSFHQHTLSALLGSQGTR